MIEKWTSESAEQRFIIGSEDKELQSFAFCNDPESFIVKKIDEYTDQENIPGKIGYAIEEVSAAIDTMLGLGNIISTHPEVSTILTNGPDTIEGELALYRILKTSGITLEDMETWMSSRPSYEEASEGKLHERGSLVRLR